LLGVLEIQVGRAAPISVMVDTGIVGLVLFVPRLLALVR
jgi:hypothetical protein